ncbi:hypothetical protein GW17_00030386 [Ensete ventricosum]|nr:hypothetical protein GW17_00030386 [Ensete ventricosum]
MPSRIRLSLLPFARASSSYYRVGFLQMEAQEVVAGGESIAAAFEWGGLLDFVVDHDEDSSIFPPWTMGASDPPMPTPPPHTATLPLLRPPSALAGEGSAVARKRDPRFVCSNFLGGRTPCSCPAEKEDAGTTGAAGGERKRATKARAAPVVAFRCQVPRCEADIGELKGYHRRHRVCLRCACASSVVLDGESKRYCQQCGNVLQVEYRSSFMTGILQSFQENFGIKYVYKHSLIIMERLI